GVGSRPGPEALAAGVELVAFGRPAPRPTGVRWMTPLAIAPCSVLILFASRPPLPIALAVLGLSGLLDCFQLPANASFVGAAPPEQRSQAFGIAQGGMSLGQGLAMVVAGAAAGRFSPSYVITGFGGVGAVVALTFAVSSARTR